MIIVKLRLLGLAMGIVTLLTLTACGASSVYATDDGGGKGRTDTGARSAVVAFLAAARMGRPVREEEVRVGLQLRVRETAEVIAFETLEGGRTIHLSIVAQA